PRRRETTAARTPRDDSLGSRRHGRPPPERRPHPTPPDRVAAGGRLAGDLRGALRGLRTNPARRHTRTDAGRAPPGHRARPSLGTPRGPAAVAREGARSRRGAAPRPRAAAGRARPRGAAAGRVGRPRGHRGGPGGAALGARRAALAGGVGGPAARALGGGADAAPAGRARVRRSLPEDP